MIEKESSTVPLVYGGSGGLLSPESKTPNVFNAKTVTIEMTPVINR